MILPWVHHSNFELGYKQSLSSQISSFYKLISVIILFTQIFTHDIRGIIKLKRISL